MLTRQQATQNEYVPCVANQQRKMRVHVGCASIAQSRSGSLAERVNHAVEWLAHRPDSGMLMVDMVRDHCLIDWEIHKHVVTNVLSWGISS